MCGRYTLTASGELLAEIFELQTAPEIQPRYNIAPTQEAIVVRHEPETGERGADLLRWGLVPSWAKDPAIGNRMINARSETVAEKPAFRAAFKRRRCLAAASGFYEWQPGAGAKQPYYFHMRDDQPFGIAALWERWEDPDGDPIDTYTLITTEATPQVAEVHGRMPVIIEPRHFAIWLGAGPDGATDLDDLLRPFTSPRLAWHPVSRYVNSPDNDTPRCIEAADERTPAPPS